MCGPDYRATKYAETGVPRLSERSKAKFTSRFGKAKWDTPGSENHGTHRSTIPGPGRSSDCPAVVRGRNVKEVIHKLR